MMVKLIFSTVSFKKAGSNLHLMIVMKITKHEQLLVLEGVMDVNIVFKDNYGIMKQGDKAKIIDATHGDYVILTRGESLKIPKDILDKITIEGCIHCGKALRGLIEAYNGMMFCSKPCVVDRAQQESETIMAKEVGIE